MLNSDQVRGKVRDVIVKRILVRDFDLWLADASWSKDADPSAKRMVHKAQMLLVDYFNNGELDDNAILFRGLSSLLNSIFVSVPVEVTSEQQKYFSFAKSLRSRSQASHLVAA